jgi:hypothetical protein
MSTQEDKKVISTFETVSFPGFGVKEIVAKIDTGAYTGAIHCTAIEERDTPEGKAVYFVPFGNIDHEQITTDFYVKTVKSSNGTREKRYIISTEVELHGEVYPVLLSLTNREAMKYQVLIGRRFLRTHKMVVDASRFKT